MTSHAYQSYNDPRMASYAYPQPASAAPLNPSYNPEAPTQPRERRPSNNIAYGPTQPVIVGNMPRPVNTSRSSGSYQPPAGYLGYQQSAPPPAPYPAPYSGYAAPPQYMRPGASPSNNSSPSSSYKDPAMGYGMHPGTGGNMPPTSYPTMQTQPPAPNSRRRSSAAAYSNGLHPSHAAYPPGDEESIEDEPYEADPRSQHTRKHSSSSHRSADRRGHSRRQDSYSGSTYSNGSRRSKKSSRHSHDDNDDNDYSDEERRERRARRSDGSARRHSHHTDRRPTISDSAYLVWGQVKDFLSAKRD